MENQNLNSKTSLPKEKLKGVIQFFRESWQIYCSKVKTLLGVMAIPVGFSFIGLVLLNCLSNTDLKYSLWFSILVAIYYFGSFFLRLWAIPALLYNLKENTNFKESYQKSWKILISFIWVYFLLTVILTGGFFFFIIPGILFLVWFFLAIFVLIFEEKRGFDCLFRSKHLISGRFWSVFRRILMPVLIVFIIVILTSLPVSFSEWISELRKAQINKIISYFLGLLITPFVLIYGSLIYKNLKEIKTEISYPFSLKIRRLKYLLPGILGALIIGFGITIFLLHIFLGRDEIPLDDSDLRLERIEIQNEDNAFYYLVPYFQIQPELKEEIISKYWPEGKEKLKEEKEIYWPIEKRELIDDVVQGKGWDEEFAKDILEKNREVLNDFEIAIKCPYFQNPIYKEPEKSDFTLPILSFNELENIVKLNLIEAAYFFNQGKEKKAFEQSLKVVRLGQMLEEAPLPGFMDYLVGTIIKEMGFQRIRVMLKDTNLSSGELKKYVEGFNEFTKKGEGLTKMFKAEYIAFSNAKAKAMDPYFTGRSPAKELKEGLRELDIEEVPVEVEPIAGLNFFYKPNQTQRLFAEHYRVDIDNDTKDYYNQLKSPIIHSYSFFPSERLYVENFMGKVFYNIIAVSMTGVFGVKHSQDFSLKTTQLLTAIKAYKVENGRLPFNLEELVPDYISEVPKDPFDGKPIRYSAERKIIYSVGSDLIDSGGGEGEKWREMADPTFKIEF